MNIATCSNRRRYFSIHLCIIVNYRRNRRLFSANLTLSWPGVTVYLRYEAVVWQREILVPHLRAVVSALF